MNSPYSRLPARVKNSFNRVIHSPPVPVSLNILRIKITYPDVVVPVGKNIVPIDRQSTAFFPDKNTLVISGNTIADNFSFSPE